MAQKTKITKNFNSVCVCVEVERSDFKILTFKVLSSIQRWRFK